MHGVNEIDHLWDLLEEEGPRAVLARLALEHEHTSAHDTLAAAAWTACGDLERAREALDRAAHAQRESIDVDFLWADAELTLREWRLEEARERFELLLSLEENAAVHDRLALLCELEGRPDAADQHLIAAAKLDPEGYPRPPRLREDEVDALVVEAAEALPAEFRLALERCEVRIEPVPPLELALAGAPEETPPDALGLFVGTSALEDADAERFALPPVIYLFQRNLERAAADHENLREELLVTLHHELAHLLGYDEDGVETLGLE